jgi:hypothetical protein
MKYITWSGFSTEIYEWVWFSKILTIWMGVFWTSVPKSIGRGPPGFQGFTSARSWNMDFMSYKEIFVRSYISFQWNGQGEHTLRLNQRPDVRPDGWKDGDTRTMKTEITKICWQMDTTFMVHNLKVSIFLRYLYRRRNFGDCWLDDSLFYVPFENLSLTWRSIQLHVTIGGEELRNLGMYSVIIAWKQGGRSRP